MYVPVLVYIHHLLVVGNPMTVRPFQKVVNICLDIFKCSPGFWYSLRIQIVVLLATYAYAVILYQYKCSLRLLCIPGH